MQSGDFTQMVADGDDGSRIIAFSMGYGDDPFTGNILGATAPRIRDDDDPRGYADWTPEEIESMLHKVEVLEGNGADRLTPCEQLFDCTHGEE